MAIGLMLVLVSGVFAQAGQTYYYRYVETVDKSTGVRSRDPERTNLYITFTRNSCYNSNEKGVINPNAAICAYQGEKNNLYVYLYKNTDSFTLYNWYTFSKDYKRLNFNYYVSFRPESENEIHVYERVDQPSGAPGTLY